LILILLQGKNIDATGCKHQVEFNQSASLTPGDSSNQIHQRSTLIDQSRYIAMTLGAQTGKQQVACFNYP
jgi:hypothetical protein